MTLPYTGLLGVFLAVLFTRRGNAASSIAALFSGLVTVLALQPWAWAWFTDAKPLAWPWHMVLGTAVAFGVCCLPKSVKKEASLGPG
jgi:Na+/proline symporter